MWTMEPVVASVQIRGNDVDLQTAKDKYFDDIEMIDMLTTKTHRCNVIGNDIRGRWAGGSPGRGTSTRAGRSPTA